MNWVKSSPFQDTWMSNDVWHIGPITDTIFGLWKRKGFDWIKIGTYASALEAMNAAELTKTKFKVEIFEE